MKLNLSNDFRYITLYPLYVVLIVMLHGFISAFFAAHYQCEELACTMLVKSGVLSATMNFKVMHVALVLYFVYLLSIHFIKFGPVSNINIQSVAKPEIKQEQITTSEHDVALRLLVAFISPLLLHFAAQSH
jgi:hypothetical protein